MGINSNLKKWTIIIILIAIFIRLIVALIYSPSSDACAHFQSIVYFGENLKLPFLGDIIDDEFLFFQPPLFYLIAGLFYFIISTLFSAKIAFYFVKLCPVIFGILQIYLSYLIIKHLSNKKIAFYSLIFLSFLPIHIFYSSVTFLDMPLAFFVTLSIFFLIKDRYILSALSLGCALLIKNSALFALPLIFFYILLKIFLNLKEKNIFSLKRLLFQFFKQAFIYSFFIGFVGTFWLIRNYFVFGNPFFPFLANIFKTKVLPVNMTSFQFDLSYLISFRPYIEFFLDFFGIPHGRISTISSFVQGYIWIPFIMWLFLCIIFSIPFIIKFFKAIKKVIKFKQIFSQNNFVNLFFFLWICLFFIMELIYITYWHESFTRLILPSITAYAFFFGMGLQFIVSKLEKKNILVLNLLKVVLILVCIMFFLTELIVVSYSSMLWSKYDSDFKWIKENTSVNSKFYEEGDTCFRYYTGRMSIKNRDRIGEADYIFKSTGVPMIYWDIVNPKFNSTVKNYTQIYFNSATKTIVYKKNI